VSSSSTHVKVATSAAAATAIRTYSTLCDFNNKTIAATLAALHAKTAGTCHSATAVSSTVLACHRMQQQQLPFLFCGNKEGAKCIFCNSSLLNFSGIN
jgi:hypothetical protein